MAAKKTGKTVEVSPSTVESAKEAMRTLKVDKVFVSKDGYIFPKECDARAYVGKDGEYDTVTDKTEESETASIKETVAQMLKEVLKTPVTEVIETTNSVEQPIDPVIDEHKTA